MNQRSPNVVVRDWQGREVEGPESPHKKILVWVVDPHPSSDYTECWVRGWQDMQAVAADALEQHLERYDAVELLENPFELKVRLVETTVADYQDVERSDE